MSTTDKASNQSANHACLSTYEGRRGYLIGKAYRQGMLMGMVYNMLKLSKEQRAQILKDIK